MEVLRYAVSDLWRRWHHPNCPCEARTPNDPLWKVPWIVLRDARDRVREERRVLESLPKGLPGNRALCLTPPLPEFRPHSWNMFALRKRTAQVIEIQSSSPLFQLATELRMMIYKEVFSVVVHFFLKRPDGRKTCVILGPGDTVQTRDAALTAVWADLGRSIDANDEIVSGSWREHKLLSLLLSCRQMYGGQNFHYPGVFCKATTDSMHSYGEAIDLLYSGPWFSFPCYGNFELFKSVVLPRRWDTIRHLRLLYFGAAHPVTGLLSAEITWEDTWPLIANMPGVRTVKVCLRPCEVTYRPNDVEASEEDFLAPVMAYTGSATVMIEIPWAESSWCARMREEMHFHFRL